MRARLLATFTLSMSGALLLNQAVWACATCGCSLSSDAAMGYSSMAGWRLSAEYDYIAQDQLRTGDHAVTPASVAALNNAGGHQEVERSTHNRYLNLGLSYALNADWALRALVPYVSRSLTTYGASSNPLTPDLVSGASFAALGDTKLMMSFQGFLPNHNLGIQLGLKMPTGDYGGPNAAGTGTVGHRPAVFRSGPNALAGTPGNLLDTSLQPGNGSTDLIIGGYYYQPVSQNFDAFIDGQYQASLSQALGTRGANFRPGNQTTVSVGVRYEADPRIIPQLQTNLIHRTPDQGALADRPNSVGTAVYLSPGVTVMLWHGLHVYGFVQIPIYSQLVGYQLFPQWTASAGITYAW